jgi:hypothetical protein
VISEIAVPGISAVVGGKLKRLVVAFRPADLIDYLLSGGRPKAVVQGHVRSWGDSVAKVVLPKVSKILRATDEVVPDLTRLGAIASEAAATYLNEGDALRKEK